MTAAQERALSRAQAEHITVLGRGTVKATGQRFYVVSGSRDAQYLVGVFADHLQCTCAAGKHDKVCKHRTAAHLAMAAERSAETARAVAIAAECVKTACEATAASVAARREASVLARSSAPFSIWK
jgi:hypothetical protein